MKRIFLSAFALLFSLNLITTYAKNLPAATTPIVAEYFGIWKTGQDWDNAFRSTTPFDKLNRVYIAFGKIIPTGDGHFTIAADGDPTHVAAVADRVHSTNPNADVFLTVGGDDGNNSYGGAARDPEFPANVMQFLKQYHLNGYDIDWEEELNGQDLDNLVKSMYPVFHANGFKLTLDVWPFPVPVYDMNILNQNLDQINIMSYGIWQSLANCAKQYENAGFPANQIIGGIETESDYPADTLGPNGTIEAKAKYALANGLAGMMAWRMDNDYASPQNPNYPTFQGALQLWSAMQGN